MSLLDDVSIVVTPNGYKAGELYAVKPTFALGSELVTNGDLSNGTVGFTSFNSTIANTSNTLEITNTASYGSAGADVLTTIIGKRYKFTADIKGGTSSTALMRAGKNPNGIDLLNVTAFPITSTFVKHTFYFVATTTTSYVSLWSGSPTIGDTVFFDNISVKEVTSADMDVTRATAATRVDENGLVNYAEVLGSEIIDITSGTPVDASNWDNVTSNSVDFIGLGASGVSYYNDVATGLISGKTYSISLTITNFSGSSDLGVSSQGGIPTSLRFASDGSVTKVFTSNGQNIRIFGRTGTNTATFSNFSVKEVTRDNVPRIDYTGGGCPHILSEPQRTNLIPYSEEISQYSKTQTTVIDNNTTSPDGTVNASKVTKNGASENDRVFVNNLVISNTTDYSLSAFIKNDDIVNGGVSTIGARITGGTFFRQGYEWNGSVLSVTTSNQSGTRTNVLLEDFGNGWWKIGFSFTSDGTEADLEFDIDRVNGTDTTSIFLWGAQYEEGSYGTSYIPNFGTAAGVTRNQDLFTRDGIGSLINSTEGVLFAEIAALSDDGTFRSISLSNGTATNRVSIRYNTTSNAISAYLYQGSTPILAYNNVVADVKDFHKVAIKYKSGDVAFWVDGVEVATSTSTFTFLPLTDLSFFRGDSVRFFYGKVKQLQVFKTALTDTELATLTQ